MKQPKQLPPCEAHVTMINSCTIEEGISEEDTLSKKNDSKGKYIYEVAYYCVNNHKQKFHEF